MFMARSMCGLTYVTVAALCSSCSLQKYLERWPAALNEAGLSVLMLIKGSKIPRVELSTLHFYRHYSLFMHNKPQYNWRGDYCQCVRPAQLPVLTQVSLLEQHPRYVPHRERSGYDSTITVVLFLSITVKHYIWANWRHTELWKHYF